MKNKQQPCTETEEKEVNGIDMLNWNIMEELENVMC